MIAGEVVAKDQSEELVQLRLNAIVTNEQPSFPARMVGKAQQALQLNFRKQVNDATLVVVDVFLFNIVPLGRMTDAEFNALPPGMAGVQQVPADPMLNTGQDPM